MASPQVDFRPFVEVGVLYDNGLATVAVNSQGQIDAVNTSGATIIWGISGSHSWRHTRLGLDYRGGFDYYGEQTGYDSFENSLLLGVTHQLTRHIALSLREVAAITNAVFPSNALRETIPFDPTTTAIPVTDYFNTRTIYVISQADAIIQKTARLSFDLGGGGFAIRYNDHALYGTTGLTAHGDVQYRLTRYTTVGAQYLYDHFSYPGIFGATNAQGAALTYSTSINRRLEISGYGGFMRIESLGIQSIAIDPVIAQLLGITESQEIVHRISYMPNLAARLSRTFRTGVLYLTAGHSINPGNGLFLTSTLTQVLTGYAYTGLRRWSFGASVGYERANAITLLNGQYDATAESVTVSRQVLPSVHCVLSFSARQFTSPQYAAYDRNVNEARFSVGYSPGDIPLRVW